MLSKFHNIKIFKAFIFRKKISLFKEKQFFFIYFLKDLIQNFINSANTQHRLSVKTKTCHFSFIKLFINLYIKKNNNKTYISFLPHSLYRCKYAWSMSALNRLKTNSLAFYVVVILKYLQSTTHIWTFCAKNFYSGTKIYTKKKSFDKITIQITNSYILYMYLYLTSKDQGSIWNLLFYFFYLWIKTEESFSAWILRPLFSSSYNV